METKVTVEVDVLFVSHRKGTTKKTGSPYDFVELSNGLRTQLFNVKGDFDTDFSEGQKVTATFSIDVMKERYNIELVSLS